MARLRSSHLRQRGPRRTIAMPTPVAAALRQHMKRQLEERMAAGEAWAGDTWGALMFTDEVGRPLTGSTSAFVSASCCNWQGYPQCAIVNCGHGAALLDGCPRCSRKGSDGDSGPFPDKYYDEHLYPCCARAAKGGYGQSGRSALAVSFTWVGVRIGVKRPGQCGKWPKLIQGHRSSVVEQLFRKQQVLGSIPSGGSNSLYGG